MGRAGRSAHAFVGGALAVALAGLVALVTHQPWLLALLAGYLFLLVCGLADEPSALQEGVTGPRIVAGVAGSLAVTISVLVLLKASHAPAGATTLIVSLGLLRTPTQLLVAARAVVLVTVVDWLYGRVSGRPMPLWAALAPSPEGGHRGGPDRRPVG
ncbi:HPP family protein [Micromonospora sp. NPDC005171]|uniref:HPP family protein n=1 Tax=Micromonospora sp. NPDC005171 TaxID=3156866 RepID=UPI0033B1E3B9